MFRQVHMIDETGGWALASSASEDELAILRTTDAGETWAVVSPQALDNPLRQFPGPLRTVFLDRHRAWAVVAACGWYVVECEPGSQRVTTVWYTRNGGQTWEARQAPEFVPWESVRFVFIDDLHGWFLGQDYAGAGASNYRLYRTVDGAATWQELLGADQAVWNFSAALEFADPDTGLMTFAEDRYYVVFPYVRWTEDGGSTWSELLHMPAPADDPDRFDPMRAFCGTYQAQMLSPLSARLLVLCEDPNTSAWEVLAPLLFATQDGGRTWRSMGYPGGRLQFIDAQVGWALGRTVYRTLNGGETWEERGHVAWTGQFSFVDAWHGWAVGESTADTGRDLRLHKTDDGGRTWTALSLALMP